MDFQGSGFWFSFFWSRTDSQGKGFEAIGIFHFLKRKKLIDIGLLIGFPGIG
jgi:hypothetical protein